MGGDERLDAKGGPFGNLAQTYFGTFDNVAKSCEPAVRGACRWNLELLSLGAKRAQAWLEVPVRMSLCRTPADVFGEQLRFWQKAAADYGEGGQKLMAALQACMAISGLNGVAQQHDYITIHKSGTEEEAGTAKRGERRAA